jgi:transcriptional regulator with XRE-family HTH domain
MPRKNLLTSAPPEPVAQALKSLGANLRAARLRRNLTIAQVAEKIGTGPRAVGDAEKGKPGSSVGVFVALLWIYGLHERIATLASPNEDTKGHASAHAPGRVRARIKGRHEESDGP